MVGYWFVIYYKKVDDKKKYKKKKKNENCFYISNNFKENIRPWDILLS